MKLTQLFCDVDDFCQTFIPAWQEKQLTNGDQGCIFKKLTKLLARQDIKRITTLKKNMKAQTLDGFDQLLLRKRSSTETINDQLKNIFDLEHSRHRSLTNYLSNTMAGLVAYS